MLEMREKSPNPQLPVHVFHNAFRMTMLTHVTGQYIEISAILFFMTKS